VTLQVPAFVVIGGGSIGASYVRQLLRAVAAGRLATERIHVVDRDPGCAASRETDPRVRLEVAAWDEWLEARLAGFAPDDHLVPYHWAPHLLLAWLERELARSGALTMRGGEVPARGLPFEAGTRGGDRALSYASWICPPTCIEPALCPHTRGSKDWSLVYDLESVAPGFDGSIVFRCLHLIWGVGTIPMTEILAARDRVIEGLEAGPRRYLVATSSHCHALATALAVAPGAVRALASRTAV
jgi:hypothetical protein